MGFGDNIREDGDNGFGIGFNGGRIIVGADIVDKGGYGLDETVSLLFKECLTEMLASRRDTSLESLKRWDTPYFKLCDFSNRTDAKA